MTQIGVRLQKIGIKRYLWNFAVSFLTVLCRSHENFSCNHLQPWEIQQFSFWDVWCLVAAGRPAQRRGDRRPSSSVTIYAFLPAPVNIYRCFAHLVMEERWKQRTRVKASSGTWISGKLEPLLIHCVQWDVLDQARVVSTAIVPPYCDKSCTNG